MSQNESLRDEADQNDGLNRALKLKEKSDAVRSNPEALKRLSELMDIAMNSGDFTELKKIKLEYHSEPSKVRKEWTPAQQIVMDRNSKAKGLKGAKQGNDKVDIKMTVSNNSMPSGNAE